MEEEHEEYSSIQMIEEDIAIQMKKTLLYKLLKTILETWKNGVEKYFRNYF